MGPGYPWHNKTEKKYTSLGARTDWRFNAVQLCRCWHRMGSQAYSQQNTLMSLRAVSSHFPWGFSTFVWSPQMAPEVQLLLHGPKWPPESPQPSRSVPLEQVNLTLLTAVLSRRYCHHSTRSENDTSLSLEQSWASVQFPHLPEEKTTCWGLPSLCCAAVSTTTCPGSWQSWGKRYTWGWQVSRSTCFTLLPHHPWMPTHHQLQSVLFLQNPLAISGACYVPATQCTFHSKYLRKRRKYSFEICYFWSFLHFAKHCSFSWDQAFALKPSHFVAEGNSSISSRRMLSPLQRGCGCLWRNHCTGFPSGCPGAAAREEDEEVKAAHPPTEDSMTVPSVQCRQTPFRAVSSPNSQNPWKGCTLSRKGKKKGEVTISK